MKITDIDLDDFDRYEFNQFLNCLISYYNLMFGDTLPLVEELLERNKGCEKE